jgi:hypothetical protein
MSAKVNNEAENAGNSHKSADEQQGDCKGITKEQLIEQLAAQVEHIESLPEHVKFYFCTNADLQYFMALVLHILKAD